MKLLTDRQTHTQTKAKYGGGNNLPSYSPDSLKARDTQPVTVGIVGHLYVD